MYVDYFANKKRFLILFTKVFLIFNFSSLVKSTVFHVPQHILTE